MKPGDHPEFFRFPAPPGRSRESTIILGKTGQFTHDGAPIQHRNMARAFSRWIGRHPDDGRYILQNGYDWTYFTVEETPYFVLGLRSQTNVNGVILRLSDGTEEVLDPTSFSLDEEGVAYCKVKEGDYEARFDRAAQLELSPYLVEGEDDVELEIHGRRYRPKSRPSVR